MNQIEQQTGQNMEWKEQSSQNYQQYPQDYAQPIYQNQDAWQQGETIQYQNDQMTSRGVGG